jgi:ATP-dependent helicase/nuclease subunit A
MTGPAFLIDGRVVGREAFYAVTCDPRRHVVVEACAGAGKTWMLVSRIVRALLDGARPQDILAITFTRKAAGEMRSRLQSWLREFAALTPDQACAELRLRGLSASQAADTAPALVGLHETVLSAGRSVEIRTFHAWFSQLLRAAPLELLADLGLAPGLSLLEETADVEPALFRAFHAVVMADAELATAYRGLSVRHGRSTLRRWLGQALMRRVEIELADADGALEATFEPMGEVHPAVRVGDAGLVATLQALARELDRRGGSTASKVARQIDAALSLAEDRDRLQALRSALFTEKDTPRKQLGDLDLQARACRQLDAIAVDVAQFEAGEDQRAMAKLSRCLFAEFAALKRRRGLIDMADLERVGLALLADHDLSGWVQERLDARVRHLLIDEFQDTSPLQWHALHAWLSAYAGAGGGGEGPRVFIVGDPKQSIYRFRRAEPRVFAAVQRFVVEALGGTVAACDHTRRCAPAVLDVVNRVFDELGQEGAWTDWRDHTTERAPPARAAPGLASLPSIERPPTTRTARDAELPRTWRPSLTVPRHAVQPVMREAEARTVAAAIDELVRGQGMAAGKIFVLARQRASLRLVADALAQRQLPCVAPEDTRLTDLPEAQDLLAVLDALVSPVQTLSLARALKSPLFEVGDEALLALSRRARALGSWWDALLEATDAHGGVEPSVRRAAELLRRWHRAAQELPPHDLLDRIAHEGDLMARLAAAVPPDARARAIEAVDGLLAAALTLDEGRFA